MDLRLTLVWPRGHFCNIATTYLQFWNLCAWHLSVLLVVSDRNSNQKFFQSEFILPTLKAWGRHGLIQGLKNAIRNLSQAVSWPHLALCIHRCQPLLRSGRDGTSSSGGHPFQLSSLGGKEGPFSTNFIKSLGQTLTGLTRVTCRCPSDHSIQGLEFADWPGLASLWGWS